MATPGNADTCRHTYVLSLGSNSGDRTRNLAAAIEALRPFVDGTPVLSPVIETPSITGFGAPYLNMAAQITTALEPHELNDILKHTERTLGRTPQSKQEHQVPIDIDIVLCDTLILRPADYHTPHFQLCLSHLQNP